MRLIRGGMSVAAVLLSSALVAKHFAWSHGGVSSSPGEASKRARVVLSQSLPKLDGDHLKAFLVEVNYGPAEASEPHSHPCAVIGYVVEGVLRTQVRGEPERIYKSGQSFYEAPNGVHLVSANGSSTEPAKLVAYLICDRDTPLSVDVTGSSRVQGQSK
jgi:quercetin dioxygenase-like cupin family protein